MEALPSSNCHRDMELTSCLSSEMLIFPKDSGLLVAPHPQLLTGARKVLISWILYLLVVSWRPCSSWLSTVSMEARSVHVFNKNSFLLTQTESPFVGIYLRIMEWTNWNGKTKKIIKMKSSWILRSVKSQVTGIKNYSWMITTPSN